MIPWAAKTGFRARYPLQQAANNGSSLDTVANAAISNRRQIRRDLVARRPGQLEQFGPLGPAPGPAPPPTLTSTSRTNNSQNESDCRRLGYPPATTTTVTLPPIRTAIFTRTTPGATWSPTPTPPPATRPTTPSTPSANRVAEQDGPDTNSGPALVINNGANPALP